VRNPFPKSLSHDVATCLTRLEKPFTAFVQSSSSSSFHSNHSNRKTTTTTTTETTIMASAIFCTSQSAANLTIDDDPMLLHRQNSGIGDSYSVMIRTNGSHSVTTGSTRYHDEPEVDYDEGPTELYRKIENKDWDGALARLQVAPEEAKTWVSRKEFNSNKIRWRLLPLHATCIFRSPLALIESLIEANRDGPQMKDDQGMLPLHLACRNGASKGVVLTLLQAFPDSARVRDRKGRIPLDLVEASTSQNKEAVILAIKRFEKELQAGNLRSSIAHTPTRADMMTMGGGASVIGTGMNEVDYEHRTQLFRLLLKKEWKAAATRATTHPDEAATWIVTKGFNGNLRFLPLHKACVLQPPESLVETLVTAFIDATKSRDQDGWLPLHCACFYGASEKAIHTLLVAYPKGAQSKDDEGRLPLHYACLKSAPPAVVDVLLSSFPKGAMSKDDEGRLPIHHACSKGAPEGVIESLLKASPKGAQSKDDQGRLPLHHACRKGASERTIRTLLRVYPRGAQIKDDQDKLAIHYACQNGLSAAIVNLLLNTYPESINVKNGFGYTPLAEARALETPKTSPLIQVLEKFKSDQDKIKMENGDNAEVENKLATMQQRITSLEDTFASLATLGKELRHNIKNKKDKVEIWALMEKFAEKLGGLEVPGVVASETEPTADTTDAENVADPAEHTVAVEVVDGASKRRNITPLKGLFGSPKNRDKKK
jgi:ankyrin repeat protein